MRGSLLAARDKLRVCGQGECPALVANDCAGWLTEVENSLSSVVFAVSDEQGRDVVDAHVLANGRALSERTDGRALLLDPGTYTFRFEAPGHTSVEETVSMRQSEKNRIVRVQLPRISPEGSSTPAASNQPAPAAQTPREPARGAADLRPGAEPQQAGSGVPLATYILGGTTLLGVATFAYFGLAGQHALRVAERCQADCGATIREGKRDYVIADIGLAVAIASAPAAILVYVLTDSKPAAADGQSTLQPIVLPRGGGLQWSARF
jgi:hypothetical protein